MQVDTEANRLRAVLEWFTGDDTGVSSETIARLAVGLPADKWGGGYPHDKSDRGRCVRLLRRFPWMLSALSTLEEGYDTWREQGELIRAELRNTP